MKTIKKDLESEIVGKKSKFICNVFYIQNKEEARTKIEEIRKKYYDAKHHCFAYRVLENGKILEKSSDDGEPSGTAGGPMLLLLSKNELVNILVIVTRYFGGILLGTGGLIRAYSGATSKALDNSQVAELLEGQKLKIPILYQQIPYLQYYCKKNDIVIAETNFYKEPYAIIKISKDKKEKFIHEMKEKGFYVDKIELIEDIYIQRTD